MSVDAVVGEFYHDVRVLDSSVFFEGFWVAGGGEISWRG